MIQFNAEEVLNLIISNINKLTKYFQSVKLSYENWTNNKMVYKYYRPNIDGLSVNYVKYNKPKLKFLGKLANSMNYNEIVNNKDKYGLRDIDIYFIGDLMAARVAYEIYQKCKTINKYRTQCLKYSPYQYIMLPSFLEKHYNFIPSYDSTKKQKVETSHLINIFKNHKTDLFKKYYKYLTNTEYDSKPNPILFNTNSNSNSNNNDDIMINLKNTKTEQIFAIYDPIVVMGTSFANKMLKSGTSNMYNMDATISDNKLTLNITYNNDILNDDDMHVLLFDNNPITSETQNNFCNMFEVNLESFNDNKSINVTKNNHYYIDIKKNETWQHTFNLKDDKSARSAFNLPNGFESGKNYNIGIMNINNPSSVFHIYTKDTQKDCSLDAFSPTSPTPSGTCYFTYDTSNDKYNSTTDTIIKFDSDKFQWNIEDLNNDISYINTDAATKFYNGVDKNQNSLPLMIPIQNWVKQSNIFSIGSVKVNTNTISISYTLGFDDPFTTCN